MGNKSRKVHVGMKWAQVRDVVNARQKNRNSWLGLMRPTAAPKGATVLVSSKSAPIYGPEARLRALGRIASVNIEGRKPSASVDLVLRARKQLADAT